MTVNEVIRILEQDIKRILEDIAFARRDDVFDYNQWHDLHLGNISGRDTGIYMLKEFPDMPIMTVIQNLKNTNVANESLSEDTMVEYGNFITGQFEGRNRVIELLQRIDS